MNNNFVLKNYNFSYEGENSFALSNINIEIQEGEFVVICGASGSGKTTLLKALFKSIGSENAGFVMQDPSSQIVTDKVWHEVAFALENRGETQTQIRLKTGEIGSFFGISDMFDKKTNELSGGEKQILNLASIMSYDPKMLILDEPTSQLDPIGTMNFLNILERLNKELGITILISEHRLEEVIPKSDRVIVMDKGTILYDESSRKITKKLYNDNHPMFDAMPVAAKLFSSLSNDNNEESPLSVREGRKYLSKYLSKNKTNDLHENTDDKHNKNSEYELENDFDTVISLNEIWYRYDRDSKDILKGLSLDIPRGCIYSIVGENGAGKSTIFKLIMGSIKPYRGKKYIAEKASMIPQNPSLVFAKSTAYEELQEMNSKGNINHIISSLEIDGILKQHPFDLSGGEKQKLALAKILLLNPNIILLDEPTKGLDSLSKKDFGEIITRLKKEGRTIVLVSHDLEFVSKYSDYTSLMFNGSLIFSGHTKEFFKTNKFYTTQASRVARDIIDNVVLYEDIISSK